MSVGMLCEAAAKVIRTAISRDKRWCDVAPDGSPPAAAGAWFLGVCEGGTSPIGDVTELLAEDFRLIVVVSLRLSSRPRDRRGSAYLASIPEIDSLQRQVMAAVRGWPVINTANTDNGLNDVSTGSAFFGCLQFAGTSRTQPRDGSWAGAEPDADAWLTRDLYFQGAQRVHSPDLIK